MTVAGKTGTAELRDTAPRTIRMPARRRTPTHGSSATHPVGRPRIVVGALFPEQGAGGADRRPGRARGAGGGTAGRTTRELFPRSDSWGGVAGGEGGGGPMGDPGWVFGGCRVGSGGGRGSRPVGPVAFGGMMRGGGERGVTLLRWVGGLARVLSTHGRPSAVRPRGVCRPRAQGRAPPRARGASGTRGADHDLARAFPASTSRVPGRPRPKVSVRSAAKSVRATTWGRAAPRARLGRARLPSTWPCWIHPASASPLGESATIGVWVASIAAEPQDGGPNARRADASGRDAQKPVLPHTQAFQASTWSPWPSAPKVSPEASSPGTNVVARRCARSAATTFEW